MFGIIQDKSYAPLASVQRMSDIRRNIAARLQEVGSNPSRLALQLGKSRAYIHQYLKGEQKDLPYEMRLKIMDLLDMEPDQLDLRPIAAPAAQVRGPFDEDAEPYVPPREHWLARSPRIGYFRMKTTALDQHPERIMPGHLLAFDLATIKVASIPSGRIVVAQLFDKHDLSAPLGYIVRQLIAPNKLITNSSDGNDIISLDDPALPFELVVRGTLRSVVRELD